MTAAAKPSLVTLGDFFRLAVRRFRVARLAYGHGTTNAVDEAAFMTEAGRALLRYLIDTLKVHRVEALIRPENKPSAALAKRLGFRLEGGPLRDRWLVGDKWHSVMLYGLIAGEENKRER